eukprot:PLAT10388.1.p1 GENE.PLAT10388.1~~PLAT10388.1.p1  ORF type:complete len:235 (-),score=71.72 PLAT10388.1:134-814(-)
MLPSSYRQRSMFAPLPPSPAALLVASREGTARVQAVVPRSALYTPAFPTLSVLAAAAEPAAAVGGVAAGVPEGGVELPFDPNILNENCLVKGVLSLVIGGAMGVGIGALFGLYGALGPDPMFRNLTPEEMKKHEATTTRETLRHGWKMTVEKSKTWGKNFALFGGIYTGVECFIEQQRAHHDLLNSALAGCITGVSLAVRQGTSAMVLACGGIGAISMAIDALMEH